MEVRYPRHAGTFYNAGKESLKEQLAWCFKHRFGPGSVPKPSEGRIKNITALICPHAGYMYSGPVAAHAYYQLALDGTPETAVLLGPNHVGVGSALSIVKDGVWRTPLGDLSVDEALADEILRESDIIDIDPSAHLYEHSLEVQLPFLQFIYGSKIKIVPVTFLIQDLKTCREVGEAIAKAIDGKNVVVIASTDLTHYESQASARSKDKAVIEAILRLDEELLYETVEGRGVSMCGYGPTISAIVASKVLGAKEGSLLCYKTSGDMTGDLSAVVGYASIVLRR
ncbi:AmmeMemoRadiSam system protein B [Candidatus Bathyarchaeota archaeon]|nr:AmmeMemoRadiSam system protein B [Candidatus Bathyarchaeota archaeon]